MATPSRSSGPGDLLDGRTLGRATLDRQLLLARAATDALAVVARLVGLQAQSPFSPYYGLWSRIAGFVPDDLAGPLQDRRVVRIGLMRGTVHLVTADDALWLRPLAQPIYERGVATSSPYAPALRGIDRDRLLAVARAAVEQSPRTNPELKPILATEWPDRDAAALVSGARALLPLVQVPPRAVWGHSGQARVTTVEAWLGRPLEPAPPAAPTAADASRLVERYLAAFGPASVADVQVWSGLTRLREVVDGMGDRLRPFRDEHGRALWDLPDVPRPDPGVEAPARFLPEFDNLLRSHDDRTRVMDEDHRRRLTTPNGVPPHTFLVDGRVAGTWRLTESGGSAVLDVTPFGPLPRADADAVAEEGRRLLAFAAPAATPEARVHPPG